MRLFTSASRTLIIAVLAASSLPFLQAGTAAAEQPADEVKYHAQTSSAMRLHSCPAEIELINLLNEPMKFRIDLEFHDKYAFGTIPPLSDITIPLETMFEDRPEMVRFYDFREEGWLGRTWTKNCKPEPRAELDFATLGHDCSTPQVSFEVTNLGQRVSDTWQIHTVDGDLFYEGAPLGPGESVEVTLYVEPELSWHEIGFTSDAFGPITGFGLGCPRPLAASVEMTPSMSEQISANPTATDPDPTPDPTPAPGPGRRADRTGAS